MKLSNLFSSLNLQYNLPDLIINEIVEDSRKANEGNLFIAPQVEAARVDEYVKAALANKCKVIIAPNYCNLNNNEIIKINDVREVKSQLAKIFFPKAPEYIYAVTGTNGKTSTVHFLRQILSLLNLKSASIGTLGLAYDFNDYNLKAEESSLTTPGAIELHKILNSLKEKNINHLCMEASSHGLDQSRLDNTVNLYTAAFTNFSHEHLDYHKTMEEYFNAKSKLFRELLPAGKQAVLNADMKEFSTLKDICLNRNHKIITFGKNANEVKLKTISAHDKGLDFSIDYFGKNYNFSLPLVGEFQIFNIICALAMSNQEIVNNLEIINKLTSVPGRMEKVEHKKNIFVDYSHKPEALEKAISMLKQHTKGKIITVFGCGGNRDTAKRPVMGKIATELSDFTIITDDNPRFEDANEIRKEIIAGTINNNYKEVGNRKNAIIEAINLASDNDIVLIAGKGHEKKQIIGNEYIEFDDVEIARQV